MMNQKSSAEAGLNDFMARDSIKKFSIYTFGCKVNSFDSEIIRTKLLAANFVEVSWRDKPDLCIVNTCTVTGKSDRQARQILFKLKRENPNSIIVAAGCYPHVYKEEIENIGCADYILDNNNKFDLLNILTGKKDEKINANQKNNASIHADISHAHTDGQNETDRGATKRGSNEDMRNYVRLYSNSLWEIPRVQDRKRALLKIQDGCDLDCSYCIIPKARGTSRSLEIEKIGDSANGLIDNGFKELILTGINIGKYGQDQKPERSLVDLLSELIKLKGDFRIRLSSIEPEYVTDELIDIFLSSKMCSHFHIPIQSGDPKILNDMRRKEKIHDIEERIFKIKSRIQNSSIGTDIICGFPTESDENFLNTLNFLERVPLSYFHIFPYSPRKGSNAFSLGDPVPSDIKKERSKILRELGQEKRTKFSRENLGLIERVLIEESSSFGVYRGFTDNYIEVKLSGDYKVNEFYDIKLVKVENGYMEGEKRRAE